MFREVKWSMLLSAALYIVLGLVLVIFPATTAHTICYMIAGIAIVVGLVNLVVYFTRNITRNYYRNDFVMGLMMVVLGIFVIYKADLVIALVPFIIGLCIIVSGLFKLQGALDVQRMGGNSVVILGLAIVNVVIGILMVINPFESTLLLCRLLGVGLLFSGLTDMMSTLYLSGKMHHYMKKMDEAEDAIKVRELTEPSESAEQDKPSGE
ncbi:MAG: DUF308 domain-containing protein [Acetatifactor sp.]|nr:DUF308 domain-containing protein [Acetatifactor sp.]